ncbi:MAG TPA: response regulator [Desulfuromonadaceae bacterium]|jgi:light-regulated signal transduction histidine kinase (bacteriophytochrome)
MRILIADDDPAFRHLIGEILVKWGYQVVVCANGNEAWGILQWENPPRIAILDWLMPGLEGIELCGKIRQEIETPYIYVILLTAHQQHEFLVQGMEAGADDYITKPLNINELKVRLKAGQRIIELQKELIAAREKLAVHASDLEAANRDLEAFSYAVSNDLLNSLLAIGSNAHAIQELICSKQDERCKSYTKKIYDKTKRLGELISLMHDYFRPTRAEFHEETVDLSEMAGNTAESMRKAHPEREVNFRIEDGVLVKGDPSQLQLVLEHLFSNAWKHTAKREDVLIEFGLTAVEGKPVYYVRDNGIGFDMAHAEKLFMPFQRLPGTEGFAGQGIGLATVERIIRRHGGKVWAEGEPGKGATFYFTLSSNGIITVAKNQKND